MRIPKSLIAASLITVLGIGGLVRGAIPVSSPSSGTGGSDVPIQITGAYVRQPVTAADTEAAAYFSVTNNTSVVDSLTSVLTGAGQSASLHTENGSAMTLNAAGLSIAPHQTVRLSPGVGHVMIQGLYGQLQPGQTVNLQLSFAHAGTIIVTAPVIGKTDPVPAAGGHN